MRSTSNAEEEPVRLFVCIKCRLLFDEKTGGLPAPGLTYMKIITDDVACKDCAREISVWPHG